MFLSKNIPFLLKILFMYLCRALLWQPSLVLRDHHLRLLHVVVGIAVVKHAVVKIFGHKRKLEGGEQIGAVQRMHTRGG